MSLFSEHSDVFLGIWPKRGSMRSGACFEHPTWEPPTNAPACSSLLPTPTAAQPGGTAEQHLARKQRMPDGANRTSVTDLRMAIEHYLLPTPTVGDSFGTRNRTSGRSNPDSQHHDGVTLTDWTWEITGRTGDAMAPPSPDGNTPSDDPHQRLPTIEDD